MTEKPRIDPEAQPTLDRLARFWFFKRKEAAAALACHIATLEQQSAELFEDRTALRAHTVRQQEENDTLAKDGVALRDEVRKTTTDLQHQKEQYTGAVRRYAEVSTQLKIAGGRITTLQDLDVETKKQLKVANDEVEALEQARSLALETVSNLEKVVAHQKDDLATLDLLRHLHENLEATHRGLRKNYDQISQEHLSLSERFELVQRILSQQEPPNPGVMEFARLIHEEYQAFAARESSLADDAGATLELLRIQRELEIITNFPAISGKTVLGIAGGFSSGKSAFINSFIEGRSVKLAEGINPVTVIPSYVVCSPRVHIRGYCASGGSIELEAKLYGALSHEFLNAFGFDLRRIMPSMSVEVPMREDLFAHLCLIDTPGYNPGAGGSAQSADRETASRFVGQCSAMIWVIGLDPAGTATRSDIEFIRQTGLHGESLYIVLNKADLKSEEDIDEIMVRVADDLDFDGIPFAGICAYSSTHRRIYRSNGQSLEQFIQSHNQGQDVLRSLDRKIDDVFSRYGAAIHDDIQRAKDRRRQLKLLEMQGLETGGTEEFGRLREICQQIESTFEKVDFKSHLVESEQLCRAFKDCARRALADHP